MLTYQQLYKEVAYYNTALGMDKKPSRIYAYVIDDNYKLTLIAVADFDKYDFIGYTYNNSFYPVVCRKQPTQS